MPDKFQYFNGLKFTRDDSTGYYLCAFPNEEGKRQRMHVYVWEYYNGKVPHGYHVHHVDGDKSNNDIANLQLLLEAEHLSLHGKEKAELARKNVSIYASPEAKEWHSSKSGRKWHKEHYEKMKDKLYQKKNYVCQNCGKQFTSSKVGSRFCSNNCKSKARRKSGVDNEIRVCPVCGKNFLVNKYYKQVNCSRSCGNKSK